jgi:ParB family transcriptional regulator, chromosome partitioning protein
MQRPLKRLGKGLDALVSRYVEDVPAPSEHQSHPPQPDQPPHANKGPITQNPTVLPIDTLIPNPLQPRREAAKANIDSLARSISHSGMLQPIAVRYRDGQYQIIAGERRWHAARRAGLTSVPVLIRNATDEQMLELALIENIQREDLNPIDRAHAYREFCTRFELRPEAVAERLGEDRTTVVNYLRLLDLPDVVREFVVAGRLAMGHARCLLGVDDDERRVELAEAAITNQWSVRALEEAVRSAKRESPPTSPSRRAETPQRSPHIRDMERRFEEALKTKVSILEGKRKGSGRILIEFYTLDDFDRIASSLGVAPE